MEQQHSPGQAWLLGIDEAGYGPNLGPFVMAAVRCRARAEHAHGHLWPLLTRAVRRGGDRKEKHRLLLDDSKVVYSSGKNLAGLERGVSAILGGLPESLCDLVTHLCPQDHSDLTQEAWYTGRLALPTAATREEVQPTGHCPRSFTDATAGQELTQWRAAAVVICPQAFNGILDRTDTKSAVLAHAFVRLLSDAVTHLDGAEPLFVCTDKQGGRNHYAPQIQHALPGGHIRKIVESEERSRYTVTTTHRSIELDFRPGADGAHFCVALASMVAKYLRELFMAEFNAFWTAQVPDLQPTAGYPGDAPRFFTAILPTAEQLAIPHSAIWRRK